MIANQVKESENNEKLDLFSRTIRVCLNVRPFVSPFTFSKLNLERFELRDFCIELQKYRLR